MCTTSHLKQALSTNADTLFVKCSKKLCCISLCKLCFYMEEICTNGCNHGLKQSEIIKLQRIRKCQHRYYLSGRLVGQFSRPLWISDGSKYIINMMCLLCLDVLGDGEELQWSIQKSSQESLFLNFSFNYRVSFL